MNKTNEKKNEQTESFPPTYQLGKVGIGKSVTFAVAESKVRKITVEDKETKAETEKEVIYVVDLADALKYTLWLTSKSLRNEFSKLENKHKDLKGLKIVVTVREYKHPQWGVLRGYNIQEMVDVDKL